MEKQDLFHFKQFAVNQAGCGMKVNTDAVLLAALAGADKPSLILDIGTGTGVIALMLAQRFTDARIAAVEIDQQASEVAAANFKNSPFANRVTCHPTSFQEFALYNPLLKFDLIVSNPPFFTKSLKNADLQKQIARHADEHLFADLVGFASSHLTEGGSMQLIIPLDAVEIFRELLPDAGLHINALINIRSDERKKAHRQIITIGRWATGIHESDFVIYESEKKYSEQYQALLKDFLTIF